MGVPRPVSQPQCEGSSPAGHTSAARSRLNDQPRQAYSYITEGRVAEVRPSGSHLSQVSASPSCATSSTRRNGDPIPQSEYICSKACRRGRRDAQCAPLLYRSLPPRQRPCNSRGRSYLRETNTCLPTSTMGRHPLAGRRSGPWCGCCPVGPVARSAGRAYRPRSRRRLPVPPSRNANRLRSAWSARTTL